MSVRFRLAVGQALSGLMDTVARLDWLAGILPGLAAEGVDLLLLPELFATGYNIGAATQDMAEPADGPFAKTVAALAQSWARCL